MWLPCWAVRADWVCLGWEHAYLTWPSTLNVVRVVGRVACLVGQPCNMWFGLVCMDGQVLTQAVCVHALGNHAIDLCPCRWVKRMGLNGSAMRVMAERYAPHTRTLRLHGLHLRLVVRAKWNPCACCLVSVHGLACVAGSLWSEWLGYST